MMIPVDFVALITMILSIIHNQSPTEIREAQSRKVKIGRLAQAVWKGHWPILIR